MNIIKKLGVFLLLIAITVTNTMTFADSWYQSEIEEAYKWQIMPNRFEDLSLDAPITRGEFAEAIILAYTRVSGSLPETWNTSRFSDQPNVYAQLAGELDFVSGYSDGTYRSNDEIKREELFVMITNLITRFESDLPAESTKSDLTAFSDASEISEWAKHASSTLINMGILTGTSQGTLAPKQAISRAQAMVLLTRTLSATKSIPVASRQSNYALYQLVMKSEKSKEYATSRGSRRNMPLESLYTSEELMRLLGDNSTKYAAVFGDKDAPRYQTAEEALKHMVHVTVDVWTLKADGTKTSGQRSIKVHVAIADIVTNIFKEIYQGPEQFPIKDVGGYAWRSSPTSEHRWGLAIDLNANENYMIRSNGSIVAGTLWSPGVNPYSIKPDGDVVRAFKKYGFSWGGDAWSSSNDYMHFSFLGK